ncbi:DUF2877 domain-containing protein [Lentibacillus amyloliquefaciens]|uniref:DUF2877 domain-containing protein n=1 Tax=Lentibacillus amyloliquefaciens TaxID=1472767 RepID=A0A0U4F6R5_9BACI|nr:DUF2877 domain-containing protein [Lentibacillus amyloliquefaciens]ALX48483.1 hypothetical protein AOX59_07605 [Lentibacillus amyloliquefaciens]
MGYTINGNFHTRHVEAFVVSDRVDHILQHHTSGKVHSLFDTSFNLLFGKRLIHVGVYENGMAPFGIGLNRQSSVRLRRSIQQAQKVIWDSGSKGFVFGGGATLTLRHAERTNHLLESKSFDERVLMANLRFTTDKMLEEKWQTGLTQTEEEHQQFMRFIQMPLTSGQLPFIDKLNELRRLAKGSKTIASEHVLDYWIGRGLGLTPSGDDIITGMCAMLSILGSQSSLQEQLRHYLYQKGMERTTPVGYEYLWYAAHGEYHTHLLDMCQAMLKSDEQELMAALQAMKMIGHTSGADTVSGILLGIKSRRLMEY